MSLKKNLILATIAGAGAGIGSIATALIMTKQCHEMMEHNKKENEELRKSLNDVRDNVAKADNSFRIYKEKVSFLNEELVKMNSGTIEAFRGLKEEGKGYQKAIEQTSKKSIEMVKVELKDMLDRARIEINTKKQDVLISIDEKLADGEVNKIEKMIEQIETDNGRKTNKKGKAK